MEDPISQNSDPLHWLARLDRPSLTALDMHVNNEQLKSFKCVLQASSVVSGLSAPTRPSSSWWDFAGRNLYSAAGLCAGCLEGSIFAGVDASDWVEDAISQQFFQLLMSASTVRRHLDYLWLLIQINNYMNR